MTDTTAFEMIDNFNQHLRDIFWDEYPAQLAEHNPEEYNRLLKEFLNNYSDEPAAN